MRNAYNCFYRLTITVANDLCDSKTVEKSWSILVSGRVFRLYLENSVLLNVKV